MGGGLMQLVAYGAQDVYLTGNPQITFFKVVYRRHTNFSIECIEQQFSGSVNFGRKVTCIVARNGDLITKMYVRIVVPEVVYNGAPENKDLVKFAWVRRLGHAMIQDTELDIGGSKIDKQYGDWLNIWYELSKQAGQERGYAKMIGDVEELTELCELSTVGSNVVKPEYVCFVPLKFWFCRNNGLALPLIALQYHEVRVHITFRDVSQCFISNDYFQSTPIVMNDASLLVDYIYLDTEERRRFAQVSHEYLIEQLQFTGEESVSNNSAKYKLTYNHPCKGIYWAMKLGNFQGKKFMAYEHEHWDNALETVAKNVTLSVLDVDPDTGLLVNPLNTDNNIQVDGEGKYTVGNKVYKVYDLADLANADDLRINVLMDSEHPLPEVEGFGTGVYGIGVLDNASSVLSLTKSSEDYLNKCVCQVVVSYFRDEANNVEILVAKVSKILSNSLTIADISIPMEKYEVDNRNTFTVKQDVNVWQHNNYGVYIDGSVNPVDSAIIQLNGHDRFYKREGNYFNYVQPYQHHSNTPCDGINVYCFALKPEEHQPSGTCNFSRIDTAQLNVWFVSQFSGNNADVYSDPDNKMYIFTVNYNVLRIMSGMGGLAYSN
jgi:hypothetical protein